MRGLLLASLACAASAAGMYTDHHLFGVVCPNDETAAFLEKSGWDLWNDPLRGKMSMVNVRIAPEDVNATKTILRSKGIAFTVLDTDIQDNFDRQKIRRKPYVRGNVLEFDYFQYHDYAEIMDWIHDMHEQFPQLTEVVHLGWSTEEREILGLKITSPLNAGEKKRVWSEHTIHAREWLSPATGLYTAAQLLLQYTASAEVRLLVDRIEWTFVPVLNPDGYHETWVGNRLWRKTRSVNPGSTCLGTDGNRNFGYRWGGEGASPNPCSETFHGSSAWSEPEIAAVRDYVETGPAFSGFLDWHCCGAMWMTPWSWTRDPPPAADYERQQEQNVLVTNAIRAVNGTQYAYGQASHVIYITSGGSRDWSYGEKNILYSIGIELPGEFTSPPEFIEPNARETWAALKAYGLVLLD